MIVNEIDSFPIGDYNKLLMIDIIDKYDIYIKKIFESLQDLDQIQDQVKDYSIQNNQFSTKIHLEIIQNLCMNISLIDDNHKIEYLYNKLLEIDIAQIDIFQTNNKFKEIIDEINS